MKLNSLFLVLAIAAFLCSPERIFAQPEKRDTTQRVMVQTKDGNQFIGRIVGQNAETLTLQTDNMGEIRLPKNQVVRMSPVSNKQLVNGEYWPENPHGTRYLFGPNGYGLRKGEGYYSNNNIFFNQVSYGFTNNFTVGLGLIPLFLFAGSPTPVWITPKVSIPIKKDMVNLGVGGLFATVLGGAESDFNGSFGVAYGQLTLGSRDRNVNFGLGYGYAGDDWADTPTLSISGTYRTGKKFALLTENYLFDTGDDNYLLLSLGGRFIGRRIAVDAGLLLPTQTGGDFFAFPWLGLNVPFGKTTYRN